MLSDSLGKKLYLVAVRYGDDITEHVCDTESDNFTDALRLANRVRRWLSEGWAVDLPDAALDLRDELERAGFDCRTDVTVQVVRLDPRGPGRWDCDGAVLATVVDAPRAACDEDDDCDDTPLMPALPRVRVLQNGGR